MTTRWILALLLLGWLGLDGGGSDGREGNRLYEEGDYAGAEEAYREGIARQEGSFGATYVRLWHNLGATLHQQSIYDEALGAFERSLSAAEYHEDRVRALYNAGVTATEAGQYDDALNYFRRTLLEDPTHDDARYNYEYVKRMLDETPEDEPTDEIEPSDYAEQLKAEAEALAAEQDYREAYNLMMQGLQRDSTVIAYESYIQRLSDIALIEELE